MIRYNSELTSWFTSELLPFGKQISAFAQSACWTVKLGPLLAPSLTRGHSNVNEHVQVSPSAVLFITQPLLSFWTPRAWHHPCRQSRWTSGCRFLPSRPRFLVAQVTDNVYWWSLSWFVVMLITSLFTGAVYTGPFLLHELLKVEMFVHTDNVYSSQESGSDSTLSHTSYSLNGVEKVKKIVLK